MPKTQNVLAMINIFKAQKTVTAAQLAEQLGLTPRTVYRYMRELRAAGYQFKTKTGLRGYTEYVCVERPEQ